VRALLAGIAFVCAEYKVASSSSQEKKGGTNGLLFVPGGQ
jgi:hypothetical protein